MNREDHITLSTILQKYNITMQEYIIMTCMVCKNKYRHYIYKQNYSSWCNCVVSCIFPIYVYNKDTKDYVLTSSINEF